MIRVSLRVPDRYVARARHVVSVFAQQWGIPVHVSLDGSAGGADIRYGPSDSRDGERAALEIPFDPRVYEPSCRCALLSDAGVQVWGPEDSDPGSVDLIGSCHRLLTFLDEQQVDPAARDRRGVFLSGALPAARRDTTAVPLVDDQAALILQRLERARPGLSASAMPKWPDGKRYAIAITHDTDAVSLGAPRELATNAAKLVVHRDPTFAAMVRRGLRYVRNPDGNPLFGFPRWRRFEAARELRGCFYVYAKVAAVKRDLNNCKSSVVEQRVDWRPLREMAAEGWEFGFHAPINAKDSIDALAFGKQWLEDRLGVPLRGLRHHYWALDWVAPHTTFRKHVNSGFRYDASIAWRDVSGFRAASCHPFRPFDPDRGKSLPIYELPSCLMDGHVLAGAPDVPAAVQAGLETVARVKQRGGVAVLDWHTESACNTFVYRDHVTALDGILRPLLDDPHVWWATPWDIVQHWHRRCAAVGEV